MDIRIIYGIGLGVLIVAAVLFFVFLGDAEHPLILHFDKYQGIDLWGDKTDVLKIIIFGFILQILNIGLAFVLYSRQVFPEPDPPESEDEAQSAVKRKKVLPFMLGFFNIFISVLILIAVGVIISVN